MSHTLVRWVRIGNDLESGEQLADLLEVKDDMNLYVFVHILFSVFIEMLVVV